MSAALELKDVTKIFGSVKAVNKLNLTIEQGECFSFLGPSGCGKTTTLRMIAGFENLDEGELYSGGKLFSSSYKHYYLPPEKRDFGMVFQAFAVWPHMTVYDNVAFPLKIKKLPKNEIAERTEMALKATSLTKEAEMFPQKLSGGQQQRIALARAVAINPKVMLLDEPLSNLDPHLREEIMKEGVVQQVGGPLDIYNDPANKFVFSFIGLSDFIPVKVKNGQIFVDGGEECGPVNGDIPKNLDPSIEYDIACRPSEIDFAPDGVRAQVVRRTYLGDIVDYLLKIGNVELRVQKPRRHSTAQLGETCHLRFNRLLWYDRKEETASKT